MKTRHFLVLASMCFAMGACSTTDKSTQTPNCIPADADNAVDSEVGQMKIEVEKAPERKVNADAAVLNTVREESVTLPQARSLDDIDKLLKKGADVNYHDADGKTALMYAAERDDVDAAKKLIKSGAYVNALDNNALTALFYAKSVKMARLLLDNGADIHHLTLNNSNVLHNTKLSPDLAALYIKRGANIYEINRSGFMPIHYASDAAIIKSMLDAGVSPNARVSGGRTPLTEAYSDDAVKLLIDNGAKINIETYGFYQQYIIAIHGGSLLHTPKEGKAIARLIEAGLDPNQRDSAGTTPIFFAQDEKAVKALVKAGADANAISEKGWSPLILAQKGEVVKALLDAGADASYIFDTKYEKFSTLYSSKALLQTLRYNPEKTSKNTEKDTEAVKALIKAGVDVNFPVASDARLPIHIYENEETFDELIKAGADIHKLDGYGRSALHHQINPHNVKKLIDAGLDVNLKDIEGKTPIFYHTTPESLKMLLDAGADVSIIVPSDRPGDTTETGNNVLFFHSDPECIRLLVKAGAKINAKNKLGNTPLHNAKSPAAIKALLELGADLKTRNDKDETPFDSFKPTNEDEFNLVTAMYLAAGMNPNAYSPDGLPLIYSFIKNHNASALEILLKAGANPDGKTGLESEPKGITPLITALTKDIPNLERTQTLESVRLLLKAGADPNRTDASSRTPLMHARSAEAVEMLLKAGANINAVDENKDNALVYYKESDAADLLLDKGIDISNVVGYAKPIAPESKNRRLKDAPKSLFSDSKEMPDHTYYSASNVKRMIKRGIDLNQKNPAGETLLMRAADEEAVKLLINAGADPKAVSGDDHSVRYKLTHRDESVTRVYGNLELSADTMLKQPTSAADEIQINVGYNFNQDISDEEANLSQEEKERLNQVDLQSIKDNLKTGRINSHIFEILRRDCSIKTLKQLKEAGVNISSDVVAQMALLFASDVETLKFLKQEMKTVNPNLVPISAGKSFFMNKSADAIQYMFDELGYKGDATIRNGTPRDIDALRLLLNSGAQPFDKLTILKFINDPAALKLLIDAGAFSERKDFKQEFLDELLESLTNPESAQILINAGDKTETPKPKSALHFQKSGFMEYALIHASNPDVARVFIENGALESHDDELPYPLIAQQNNHEIFNLLIAKGARIPDDKAQSLINRATNPDLIKMLIAAGAEFDRFDSPLLANQLTPDAAKQMIRNGADPNAHSIRHGYALFYQRDPETKRVLLKAGANADTRKMPPELQSGRVSRDDVICPIMSTSLICVETLAEAKMYVEAGADLNAQTNQQITPLMNHASLGHCDIVQYLLQKGADPWLQSSTYQTAYDLATTSECRAMLRKAMTK